MLTATEEPRVDLRLLEGSRTLGTRCHTGVSHSSRSPAVAALYCVTLREKFPGRMLCSNSC